MSATIYQFPAGGRRAVLDRLADAKPGFNFAAARNVKTVLGAGWYHDEAIEEDRTPKS